MSDFLNKFKEIGTQYLQSYDSPKYIGPFAMHTNQNEAKLLVELGKLISYKEDRTLDNEKNAEKTIFIIMLVLGALPKQGVLSKEIRSSLNFEMSPPHQNRVLENLSTILKNQKTTDSIKRSLDYKVQVTSEKFSSDELDKANSYYRAVKYYNANCPRPSHSRFNIQFAEVVYNLFSSKDVTIKRMFDTQENNDNLMKTLANIGCDYLEKYPRSTSTLLFFNRHTQQRQAYLLATLPETFPELNIDDQDSAKLELALKVYASIAKTLSKGELSLKMYNAFKEYGIKMDSHDPKVISESLYQHAESTSYCTNSSISSLI